MKIISFLLIISLLYSCVAYKREEVSKTSMPSFEEKMAVLHVRDLTLYLKNILISDGQVNGNVLYSSSKTIRTHIYVDSIMIKPELGQYISISIDKITKIEVSEINTKNSLLLTVGTIAIIGVLASYLARNFEAL